MNKKYMMTKRKDMTEFYMINSFLIALNNLANLQFDVDGYKDLSNKKKEWLRNEVIEWVDKFLME